MSLGQRVGAAIHATRPSQDDLCRALHRPTNRRHRLRPARLAELDAWLASYRRFWAERLDALQAHLDEEHA